MHDDYRLCGWRVHSEISLPDLLPWTGDPQAPVELLIELGAVEAHLAESVHVGPIVQHSIDGTCRFAIDGVAAYRIAADGRSIRIQPHPPEDFPAIRAFLFGMVFAIACQRRGLLPLHACCVRLPTPHGDVAVAFSAASGSGKSTLASAFIRRGYPILADDVTLVCAGEQGTLALPTFPRIKLWGDALERVEVCGTSRERVRRGMDKFSIGLQATDFSADEPLKLATLYHLERVNDVQHVGQQCVMGLDASIRFAHALYQAPALMRVATDKAAHFSLATQLAAGIADHVLLRQLSGFEHLDDLVSRIVDVHARERVPA